jgi:membrane protease YdiL (CAAX protease family)
VSNDGFGDDRDDRDDDRFGDNRDDREGDGFEWGTNDDESGRDDRVERGQLGGDDGGGTTDRDDAFEPRPPNAEPAVEDEEDDDVIRRADAGIDADVAPWETGAGKGGLVRAVGVSVGIIVAAFLIGLALGLAAGVALLLAGFAPTSTPLLVVSLLGTQAGFVVAVLLFLRWRGEPLSNVGIGFPDVRSTVLVVVGLVVTLVTVAAVSVGVQALNLQPAQNATTAQASGDPSFLLLLVPVMIFVVGPAEELLFRGVVQRRIREHASAPVAILLGGLLFASVHFVALVGDLSAVATTIGILFVPSLVFGALYEYAKNVVVNALVHGLYNSVLLLIAYATLEFAPETAQPDGAAAIVDALAVLL